MKKLLSLKYRIIFLVVVILVVCSVLILVFERIEGNVKDRFSDRAVAGVFDNVRIDNEAFHIRQAGEELQDFAGSDEVIAFLGGRQIESNRQVVSGLFITLSETTGASKIVLLDKGVNVVYSEQNKGAHAGDGLFSSPGVQGICKKAGETWENQGFSLDHDGKVVFIVVTAVIDDDDQVLGFAACEMPVSKLARSFARTVKGKIGFQGKDLSFTGSSDPLFFQGMDQKMIKGAKPEKGVIFKPPRNEPAKDPEKNGEKEEKASTGDQSSIYKLYPVEVSDINQSTYRYWVGLEYTQAAHIENRLSVFKPLVITGVLLAGVIFLFFLLTWQIKPLEVVVDALRDIAKGEGDLTRRIRVKAKNEIGELARWFNAFVERLHQIVVEIGEDSNVVSGSSARLLDIAGDLDRGTKDLSDNSDSVAAASEQMSVSMNSVAAATEQASVNLDTVAGAAGDMRSGLETVTRDCSSARQVANDAAAQAEATSTRVGRLGESARDIGKVIEVITDIAEQTNLLALNATIEAARAGEAGRGFAVVANEIKDLADQTAGATLEIRTKITGIQDTTDETVADVQKITQIISQVSETVARIAASMEDQARAASQVVENIEQASAGIGEVNENIAQSSQASSEITRDVSGVNTIVAHITKGSSDMNSSARELSELAARLKKRVGEFKV